MRRYSSTRRSDATGVQEGTRIIGRETYECPCGQISYSLRRARIHARGKDCAITREHGLTKIRRQDGSA